MSEVPSLLDLCLDSFKNEILYGDDDISYIYEFPSEVFECLLRRLPPMALQKLQDALPLNHRDEHEVASNCFRSQRKHKRSENFETAWRTLYKSRWVGLVREIEPAENYEFENEWQQMYWELHIQNCLDAAAEKAVLPGFEGCLGEIKIPVALVKSIGYERCQSNSKVDCSKLSYHCQQFGLYARCLRLQNVLCVAETSYLFRNSKLQVVQLQWIKSKEQVEGLCKLLNQNGETLTSLELMHCKLSSDYVNAICMSLQTQRIQHLSIQTSSFLETSYDIPVGLATFLSSARSLSSVRFCDNQLRQNIAKMVFNALLDASSSIAVLDLSENNISGWLSDFKWRHSCHCQLTSRMGKSLESLRMLKLRNSNLQKDDADCLKRALIHMPNLENLDLSDNPIEDDGIMSLLPYFVEISERLTPFIDLNLKNCELSCHGVSHLLQVLSTFKKPLNSLSIGENNLGSKLGEHLGKFLCTSIIDLDFEDIGLGSSGFLKAQEQIMEGLKIVSINISKNSGGMEAAKFISKLILSAPELVEINASYNFLPVDSLSAILSSVEIAKGKLEHLKLMGNVRSGLSAKDVEMLTAIQASGKPKVILSPVAASSIPYDDDP